MDVGTQINQYVVVEHIGRGGMADVWSARDQRLNRTVAIKTIARDLSADDIDPVALFQREAQTIAQLEHPHILPIYDFGEYQGRLYIVMRYVTGGSLEDLLADGPLAAPDALKLARAIGGALDYAHSNNVVHLDIKPSNILLDSHQSPYLADFGLAAVVGPEGRAANPGYGTLLYMAPEQLTADVLDHRADIYSFTILLFHMLTGELPFDATTSLAIKQLQFQEDLPDLDALRPDLVTGLTPLLREGTALSPDHRPESLDSFLTQIEQLLIGVPVRPDGGNLLLLEEDDLPIDSDFVAVGQTVDLGEVMPLMGSEQMALREAADLYQRARRTWAHGQGRFLMGITHFMLVNDYYSNADEHGLELDEAGTQMLLRGALEYDYQVDYWWSQLGDDARRWVTLHALRSENPPARTRALYRLETLPDSDPPRIPGLVAQALQFERDEEAKRAAVHVLATRAQMMARENYEISGEMRGSMLTTQRRLFIQLSAPAFWREVVFTPEIDTLLAELALDWSAPRIAEQAARTVGRIRSLAGVKVIAKAQRAGRRGALRTLALVRDETPYLPSEVSWRGRLYAWLDNTWRRLTVEPMGIVWRYVLALLGGFAAIGGYTWMNLPSEAIFLAERTGKTISIGLTFGFFMGFLVLFAGEFSTRLRGFWMWWSRLLASLIIGTIWGMFTWGGFTWFFLNYPPEWNIMAFGGVGVAAGFALSCALRMRGWVATLFTATAVFLPIYVAFTDDRITPIIYFRTMEDMWGQGIFIAMMIAVGGHARALWQDAYILAGRLKLGPRLAAWLAPVLKRQPTSTAATK